MAILKVNNVTKRFGQVTALAGINLEVNPGEVYGFIGPNGAGKTTCMKSVLGLVRTQKGEIRICGEKVRYGRSATNRFVGYLQDVPEPSGAAGFRRSCSR